MNEKLQAIVLSESASGNFKHASSLLLNINKFDDRLATRIIIECCRVLCAKNKTYNVIDEELYKLLVKCVSVIDTIDDSLLAGYLQSMYYILKFFIEKKSFKLVIEMEDMLIPRFMNSTCSMKISKLYAAVYALMHNAVVDLLQSESPNEDDRVLCQLCMLGLKMKSNTTSDIALITNTACSIFKTSNFLKMDINLQYDCYLRTLQLLKVSKNVENNNHRNGFSALMRILEMVVKNLFKYQEFSRVKQFINATNLEIKISCAGQSYVELCNILKCACELIIDLKDTNEASTLLKHNFEMCFRSLQCFSRKYGVTEELQRVCVILYVVLFYILEAYANVDSKVWNACMIEETQILVCKILVGIGQIVSKTEIKCNICPNCKVQTDLYTSISTVVLIGRYFKKSLDNNNNNGSIFLVNRVAEYFQTACELIKTLKEQKCSKWELAWSEMAIIIYNVAVKLYSIKHYDESSEYFLILIKNVLLLEGKNASSSVFNFDVIGTSLKCLAGLNIQTCQFQKALMFAALEIMHSSDYEKKFQLWTTAKIKSKKNEVITTVNSLQETTIVCILQQNGIQDIYPNIHNEFNNAMKQHLLLLELVQYKAVWPSRIPMRAVFKKLYEIADTLIVVKALIQIWGEDLSTAHDDVLMLLNEIIIKFKSDIKRISKPQVEMQIYLASLYVMYYYYELKKVKQKTVDEINRTVISEQQPAFPDEMPKNPNDECDLVSSYESLKLDEHSKTMKYLSKALQIFKVCIPQCTSQLTINILKEYNIFNCIVKIAQESNLHCHTIQSVQAWFISLQISKLLNNKLYILQSISSLIEKGNMNSEIIIKLLKEAEILISEIKTQDASPEIWKTLTVYHISKSMMLLHHQKLREGFEEYKQALNYFTNASDDECLKIRLNFLHLQYLQLPCYLNVEGHDVYSLAKFSGILTDIINLVKVSDRYSPHIWILLFEINQYVVKIYNSMHLPREVRCYSRNIVTFAQEEVIPLRIVHFLIYLAHADLLSVRLEDCKVKLNELSEILCLGNKRFIQNELQKEDNIVNEDVSNLAEEFAEIMLDCPVSNACQKNLMGSPVLLAKPFRMPSFIKHSCECDCFGCMNVEYQHLVMEYIHLEAKLHIHYNNMIAAKACFNGVLQLYKNLNDKHKAFRAKVFELFSCNPFHDTKNVLCEAVCATLLSYGYNLLRTNDISKAKCINEQLINLISEKKYQNMHLYNESFTQRLFIMHFKLEDSNRNQDNLKIEADLQSEEADNKDIPKTPENRQTKIIFPVTCSPRPNSPPKRRLRKIKCDFSENKVNKKEDHMMKANKLPFTIHTSPVDEIIDNVTKEDPENTNSKSSMKSIYKTPLPKTGTKKKVVLQEISPVVGNNNRLTEQDVSSAVVPSSPNAYTPRAIAASSVLESRTKLLTKKLIQSTGKKQIANNDNEKEGISSKVENNKSKRDICKNLMSELCAAEEHTQTKPVTRKRNKLQKEGSAETSRIPVSARVTRARRNM